MSPEAFAEFAKLRDGFRADVERWAASATWLGSQQEFLRKELNYDDYAIETPVVYNRELDEVTEASDPRFILVADNPGKNEQLSRNRRYLVGQSGKLAAGWFRDRLGLDFRAAVLIVNKTPVHTAKTAELRRLLAIADSVGLRERLAALLEESQRAMARLARNLHEALGLPLWISGYGELAGRGLFREYAAELGRLYETAPRTRRDQVWLFRHFSMNQFSIEMRQKADAGEDAMTALARIGRENRTRILGW